MKEKERRESTQDRERKAKQRRLHPIKEALFIRGFTH